MIKKVINKEEKIYTEGIDEELRAGTVVEFEHIPTYKWLIKYLDNHDGDMPPIKDFARSIATDHVREHNDYYTRLSTIVDDVPIKIKEN